ncbi:MAG: glycosyltransferase family 9 protein [Candidatus Eisenbacteria bacterium]|nr:glycosyltransferase family 9 protein [Candidatus Eisenbacteria bacterium]
MIHRPRMPDFPEEARFLVVETGYVGDVLVTTPALRAIRAAYPRCSITALIRPASGVVLVGNPNVSRLLPLRKEDRSGLMAVLRVASWISSQGFDAAFVFRPSFRSALIPALARVPVRAGLTSEGRGFLLTHRSAFVREESEVKKHLKVVGLVGIPPSGQELEMFLTDEERSEAAELLAPAAGRPLVAIHPGANWPIRRWPAERFAELGSRLRTEIGATVSYFAGPADSETIAAVRGWYEDHGKEQPIVLEPPNVRVMAAAFQAADVVVTNDSGPLHIASAVGSQAVFIHGPTLVERAHLPDPRHTDLFAADVPCRPCDSTKCSQDRLLCFEGVTVDHALEAVSARLARAGGA